MSSAAFYDFFRKIILQPDGTTLEADSVTDELTITRGNGVAFNANDSNDSFEIDVDYSLYVPVGTTDLTLQDVNSNTSVIALAAGNNIAIARDSDNQLTLSATVGGSSKSISNASQTNPVVITTTSDHSFTEGRPVTITDVVGMTELNGNEYYMDIQTGDTFALYQDDALTVPVDGTGFTPYSTGGVATGEYFPRTQLDDLSDVNTNDVKINDVLAYNGVEFAPVDTITGNLNGSVFGDDSTLLVDAVNGIIPTSVLNGTITNDVNTATLRTNSPTIALGYLAGWFSQGSSAIAIGDQAGYITQGDSAVAIGDGAGRDTQDTLGIAIGASAGSSNQGNAAIAIGFQAGNSLQSGQSAIAIGTQAGWFGQSGDDSIAIGTQAGFGNQHANSIILNATGSALNSDGTDRLFVKPIRSNAGPNMLTYDSTSGEISYTDIPSTGNFTFGSSVMDTDDSSAITITPSVVMSSDLTIENDLIINNKVTIPESSTIEGANVTGNLFFNDNARALFGASNDLQIYHSGTTSWIADNGTGNLNLFSNNGIIGLQDATNFLVYASSSTVALYGAGVPVLQTSSGGVLMNESTTFTGFTSEVVTIKTGATGTVDHNITDTAVFYHSSIVGDFTANFTNVPTTNNRTTSIVLVLEQGNPAYSVTAVQIDGAAQTINWQGGSAPSTTPSGVDIISFTLIRVGSSWTVLGSGTGYT